MSFQVLLDVICCWFCLVVQSLQNYIKTYECLKVRTDTSEIFLCSFISIGLFRTWPSTRIIIIDQVSAATPPHISILIIFLVLDIFSSS